VYISSFLPLQTALSGIEAAQEELNTTSNNIANANTPGYTDETVNLGERMPLSVAGGLSVSGSAIQLGTGVDAASITSARNNWLDISYRNQNAAASGASTEQSYLNQVQSLLAEPSSASLSSQLDAFWNDWNALANDPTSPSAQQQVVSDGQNLSATFSQLSSEITSVQSQATSQYAALTGTGGQVENDANQIAQLNAAISQAQAAGQNPNQLEDQRNLAIDDLSSLANVTVTNNANGTVAVAFGDASSPLVSGTTVNWPQTLTAAAGGTLGALLNLTQPGGQLAQYSAALDNVADQLATEVNNPVVNGTALATTPPFFTGTTAATIAVTPSVVANPATIQTTDTGNAGDNDVALAIANLSGGTADQSYAQFVTQLGSAAQAATSNANTQQALATSINNQRQSVSGVDLSQEETNIIQEQQAYQASAQVMNAFNEMISSLLASVGA
jgi:flagellar hook-associated protein 1